MWVTKEAPFRKTSVRKYIHMPTFSCTFFSYWTTISMNSTQLDLLLQGDHSTERDITAEKSCWEAPGMQRQGLTRPCPRSDDIWSSNRNRKVIWIMGHIRGEQQKMPEGEEKKRGKGKPLLKGLRAMQSRSTAATAGYGPGRPKQATSRRLGNKAGAVKR